MTDNIIDKSSFFRRRAKPTDDECEKRTQALMDACIEMYERLLMGDEFIASDKLRIMTAIHDLMALEIMIKRGE